MEIDMAKATKQVSTKTKARKPTKKGKRKPAAKALQANTASVKRQASPITYTYDLESWLAGYEAGCGSGSRYRAEPPRHLPKYLPRVKAPTDRVSWLAGYTEGVAQWRVYEALRDLRHKGYRDAANYGGHCSVGTASYGDGFKDGMRMAACHNWAKEVRAVDAV
jgi:hypothetical protein